jgi:hypothetical protein
MNNLKAACGTGLRECVRFYELVMWGCEVP